MDPTKKICRICLKSKPRKDVSELELIAKGDGEHENVMLFCLGIEIAPHSSITTKLCVKCFKKLQEFYDFKKLALKSENYLNNFPESESSEKNEEFSRHDLEDKVKTEAVSDDNDGDIEPLISVKDENKEESDDEYLSVIKKIKYEYISESPTEAATEVVEPVKKKLGRQKKAKYLKSDRTWKMCEECGKSVRDLKAHLERHRPRPLERKKYPCESCNKVYLTTNGRKKHFKRRHLNMRSKCSICNKDVININLHMKTLHDPESLKFECSFCNRKFLTQGRLNIHLSIHTKDRPHSCEICGGRFRLKLSLDMHRRQVHEKEKSHLCQFCSRSFFKKYHLIVHLRSHTKEKPYQCEECKKCYSSSTILNNHRLIHDKVKKFHCEICEIAFSTPNNLRSHMLSHTKDKRFPCGYCSARFHRSDHRKRHERTAHLNKMVTSEQTDDTAS